ncbi:MAG TPA: HAMP domain-containing sensor histidine kinase [Stellaceae bacterium]|jgi:signal transduction histidine kinase
MRAPEIFRTSSFRIAGISAGVFALGVLVLFAFVYWQTATHETASIDRFVERQVSDLAPGRTEELARDLSLAERPAERGFAYAALFDRARHPLAGNLAALPDNFPIDGHAHAALLGAERPVRAAAATLHDGRIVFIARDVTELRQLQRVVRRALFLGAIPALVLALAAGALLSWRELRRVRMVNRAVARIMQGDLKERLPAGNPADDFDRLAMAVNRMLDEIGRLLEEIKGVGDNIAHDLRTPLTRVRARLERSREADRPTAELEAAIDVAIAGLDQTLGIITALLRITEIEEGNRRAAFGEIDLARIVCDVAELYGPIAENAHIELAVVAPAPRPVKGDRDLLVEAVANVLDNAIKFSPADSRIDLAVFDGPEGPIVRVRDRGPGIPPEERAQVLKRFYRADKSRHLPGSGLGLGVVSAVMNLHRFRIAIDDGEPGCVFDLICTPLPAD